jgi:hypothetical protein
MTETRQPMADEVRWMRANASGGCRAIDALQISIYRLSGFDSSASSALVRYRQCMGEPGM